MLEYRYDTQLLIEGTDLDEDAINDYFVENFQGDSLRRFDTTLDNTHMGGLMLTISGSSS